MKKYRVTVNGTAYEIELEELTGAAPAPAAATAAPAPAPAPAAAPAGGEHVTSPMPGTFYVARSPEEAPFVGESEVIKPGRVVGIVEAMKVMNEIKSEFGGTVVKVLVPNGSPVEFGQRLFEIQ